MQYTESRLSVLGGVCFAVATGVCFPLVYIAFPGIAVFRPELVLPSIWSGVMLYGVPAALVGALLARKIAGGGALFVFVLGAFAVLATCLLAGPWLALWAGGGWSLARFSADAVNTALLQVFIDVVGPKGLPFLLGGLVALGLRAMVSKWRAT